MSNNHCNLAVDPDGTGGAVIGITGLVMGGRISSDKAGWDAKSGIGFLLAILRTRFTKIQGNTGKENCKWLFI